MKNKKNIYISLSLILMFTMIMFTINITANAETTQEKQYIKVGDNLSGKTIYYDFSDELARSYTSLKQILFTSDGTTSLTLNIINGNLHFVYRENNIITLTINPVTETTIGSVVIPDNLTSVYSMSTFEYWNKCFYYYNDLVQATQLSTPIISIDKNGLATWTAVANAISYIYKINDGEEIQITGRSVQLTGGQDITVKAVTSDTETYSDSEYSELKCYSVKLAVPIFTVDNIGTVKIIYSSILNGTTGCIAKVDNVEKVIGVFSPFVILKDGQTIQIKAVGDGVKLFDSDYSDIYTFELPLNANINKNLFDKTTVTTNTITSVTIGAFESAEGYCISDYINVESQEYLSISGISYSSIVTCCYVFGYNADKTYCNNIGLINSSSPITTIQFSDTFSYIRFALSMESLDTCKVEYGNIATYYTPYGFEKLTTPTIVLSDNGLAVWTTVENATGYKYKINNANETLTINTSIQLSSGQSITVKAVGDTITSLDSSYSEVSTYPVQYIIVPTVTVSNTGLATWTAVANANSYIYKINDGTETETTETSVQLTEGQSITVKAVSSDITAYTDSEYTTAVIYTAISEEPIENKVDKIYNDYMNWVSSVTGSSNPQAVNGIGILGAAVVLFIIFGKKK